ncbi:hypothetical protein R2F25_22775 [Streptomyces sp. UP1A-1]|nr:hypothetical protein [Streptomyces sp. UP1A-1]
MRITAPFFVLVERSALSRALWCTPGGEGGKSASGAERGFVTAS